MDIVSRSLREAQRDLLSSGDQWSIVSIGAPGEKLPSGFNADDPHHLRLEFHDVHDGYLKAIGNINHYDLHPPQKRHIEQLVDHTDTLFERDVYVHCAAGVSRSTSSAYTLWCHHLGEGREREALKRVVEDRRIAHPNPRIVRFADDILDREGRMIDMLSGIEDLRVELHEDFTDGIITVGDE